MSATKTSGYVASAPGRPLVFSTQNGRSEQHAVTLQTAQGLKSADLSSGSPTVTMTIREKPNSSTELASLTLSATNAANGIFTATFSPTTFDGLSWAEGEVHQCLWADIVVTISTVDYPVRDGADQYLFKVWVQQSVKGQPS